MITVYLREIDAGTDNACWAVCNRVDPGATPFFPASYSVHANRLIDDLTLMNQALIAEKTAHPGAPVSSNPRNTQENDSEI